MEMIDLHVEISCRAGKYFHKTSKEIDELHIGDRIRKINLAIPIIAKIWGVTDEDIMGRSRYGNVRFARTMAIATSRSLGLTSKRIGKLFDRDHSSILYVLRTHTGLVSYNDRYIINLKKLIEQTKIYSMTDFVYYKPKERKLTTKN